MNSAFAGKVFGLLGTCLLGYALMMDVNVEGYRMVSLDLLSTRQNLVIVGAIFLVGGVITSAIGGQGRQDPLGHHTSFRTRSPSIAGRLGRQVRDVWQAYFVGLSQGWASLLARGIALLISISLVGVTVDSGVFYKVYVQVEFVADVVVIALLILSFRKAKLAQVFRDLLLVLILIHIATLVWAGATGWGYSLIGMGWTFVEFCACGIFHSKSQR